MESASDGKSGPRSSSTGAKQRPVSSAKAREDEDDTSDSDSDGLTLKELQNRLRKKREQEPTDRPARGIQNRLRRKRREEDPAETVDVQAGDGMEGSLPTSREPEGDLGAVAQAAKEDREGQLDGRVAPGGRAEEAADSVRHKLECEVYDPSALYCLCRQPHNNRWVVGEGWGQSQGNCQRLRCSLKRVLSWP